MLNERIRPSLKLQRKENIVLLGPDSLIMKNLHKRTGNDWCDITPFTNNRAGERFPVSDWLVKVAE